METATMPAAPVLGEPDGRPTLRLEKTHLAALGLDALAAGSKVMFMGCGVVVRSVTHDPDGDGHIEHAHVELVIEEFAAEAEEVEDKRTAFERRDESAARMYAKPHAGTGIAAPEFGVFNTRYGK
jgi:hypothetical protein